MEILSLAIPGVRLVKPKRLDDERGWFAEVFREDFLAQAGIGDRFIQDNQSFSEKRGTVRGLHYQEEPFAQAKLVRALAGSILDIAVDIRRSSPTFGEHIAVRLDASTCDQLFLPAGVAHGFCTLEPNTMIAYKVSAPYSARHDRGYRWNDPQLGIDWPVSAEDAILSEKDRAAPLLSEHASPFA